MGEVKGNETKHLDTEKLKSAYSKAAKRIFFMDYDGTLAPIVKKPEDAFPSEELKRIISTLSADKKNRLYIISGRAKKTLEEWLGDFNVGMSAEHGCFLRNFVTKDGSVQVAKEWTDLVKKKNIDVSWQQTIKDSFNEYAQKLKGSTVECKEYAITFHYRQSEKGASKEIVGDLKKKMSELQSNYPTLQFLKGKKSFEARIKGITKGFIIDFILEEHKREDIDFIFCAGDDLTDEDMFSQLKDDSALRNSGLFTFTVGKKNSTEALAYVEDQKQVITTLTSFADLSK